MRSKVKKKEIGIKKTEKIKWQIICEIEVNINKVKHVYQIYWNLKLDYVFLSNLKFKWFPKIIVSSRKCGFDFCAKRLVLLF